MEVHIWSVDRNEKSSKVVEFVPENSTLRVYHLDVSGACRVACSLGWNSTVRSLDMTGVRLKSRWAKEFRWVLEQNRTLKEVNLSKTCLKDKGVVYVAAGLFKNRSLERLYLDGNWFGGLGVEHLLCPLSKFSALQNQANTMLKSVTLGGGRTKIGRDGLAAILQMLTSNQSVTHLGIYDDESLKPDDIIKIFKSVGRNATLRSLSLQGCKGKNRRDISEIGQNERSEPEIDLLKDMQMTLPKSCRSFSAVKNMLNLSPSKLPYLDQVRILVNPVEQAVRTPSIKIKTFKDEDTKISIWNLAGQHEFYSLHDLMFPGMAAHPSF
ncbi:protein TORNADO 1 [Sesamum angolense]|uniref:Protein TORNADO 1 n=1 Tax=Sesamum angolense TaxID=2727404 RepID=A0AAE1WSA0_9LAMI|nr:protein TORNADO 1 [Sesamum angolense]